MALRGLRFRLAAVDHSDMARANGKARRAVTKAASLRRETSWAERPGVPGSRTADLRRRFLDGSLEPDPMRIARALLGRGVIS